jgi:hypothetical protein
MPAKKAAKAKPQSLYDQLAKPLPKGEGRVQLAVNRFNELFGLEWGFSNKPIDEKTIKFRGGGRGYEMTIAVAIWVQNKDNVRVSVGGGLGGNHADVLNEAVAKAFLRAAALWGVGHEVFESVDETVQAPVREPSLEEGEEVAPPPPVQPRAKAKASKPTSEEVQKMAEEDGNPGKRPPAAPNPNGPLSDDQARQLLRIAPKAGVDKEAIKRFIEDKPTYEHAHQILVSMTQKAKQQARFGDMGGL